MLYSRRQKRLKYAEVLLEATRTYLKIRQAQVTKSKGEVTNRKVTLTNS